MRKICCTLGHTVTLWARFGTFVPATFRAFWQRLLGIPEPALSLEESLFLLARRGIESNSVWLPRKVRFDARHVRCVASGRRANHFANRNTRPRWPIYLHEEIGRSRRRCEVGFRCARWRSSRARRGSII